MPISIDNIVRKHTCFTNFDSMVAWYAEQQRMSACKLHAATGPDEDRELATLERALTDRAILAFRLGVGIDEYLPTQPDNEIPERPIEITPLPPWSNQQTIIQLTMGGLLIVTLSCLTVLMLSM